MKIIYNISYYSTMLVYEINVKIRHFSLFRKITFLSQQREQIYFSSICIIAEEFYLYQTGFLSASLLFCIKRRDLL